MIRPRHTSFDLTFHVQRDAWRAQFFRHIRNIRSSCGSALDFGRTVQLLTLIPKVEGVTIQSLSPRAFAWESGVQPIQLHHLCNLSITGCHDFASAWLNTIETTTLVHLQLRIFALEDATGLVASINGHRNLQDLNILFNAWGQEWTIQDFLEELNGIPDLKSLQLFADCGGSRAETQFFTESAAKIIREYWPDLRVLKVAFADFDFYLAVLDLLELESLQLNAHLWEAGHRDTSDATCVALRSLRFNGSPDHWAGVASVRFTEVNQRRFPNLETLEVVRGHGGVFGTRGSWA